MAVALCIWETEIGSDRTGLKNGHDKAYGSRPFKFSVHSAVIVKPVVGLAP